MLLDISIWTESSQDVKALPDIEDGNNHSDVFGVMTWMPQDRYLGDNFSGHSWIRWG